MEPVPTGLIGFGGRGSQIATDIVEAPTLELAAVADLREDRRSAAEAEFGVDTYPEAAGMLDRDDIEAAFVITRAEGHAPLSVQALEAGKHVLCTKPMAENVADAQEMVDAANRTGLTAAVEFQNRYGSRYWTMKGVADELNPVQAVVTNHRGLFKQRYLRPGYAYGILDSVAHRIDLANWLVGHTPTSVSGTVRYRTYSPEETIDAITIQIEYTDDRTAEVVGSMGGSGMENVCHIIGTEGNAHKDGDAIDVNEVEFAEKAGENKGRQQVENRQVPITEPPVGTGTAGLYENFGRYVRGEVGDRNIPTFEDGLDSLLIAKAAVESHEKGERVHLADLRSENSTV